MNYTQCLLRKDKLEQTTFIPSKFAKNGNILKLKENDGWSNGWIVYSVGVEVDEAHLPNAHNDIKAHRNNTGDSLPKNKT